MAQILIADDHKDFRDAVRLLLEHRGHEVLDAEDGADAVLQWRKHRPDLVILDVFMPGKNGIEALWSIRDQNADAKVIVISAGSGVRVDAPETQAREVLDLANMFGANRVMTKPVDPGLLLSTVEATLKAA